MPNSGVAALPVSYAELAEIPGATSKRVLRLLRAQVEDWYDSCRRLNDWEDQNLVGQKTPECLAEHARRLDELDQLGPWFSLVTTSPDFPEPGTAELVSLTLQDLKDARSLWHGKMSSERRRKILSAAFNES